ncbi:lectin subunit alpha-like [Amphibalanus amphitrite]|uniref:lectin subunit alpha-like n=1 Tax=Amphibalanus amphitrite TaxID=1232801 RepID=UPI001C923B9C|nr:lectin subunit alpha-like [Amphibalanus amphitrite]
MRLIIPLVTVALAGLATASGGFAFGGSALGVSGLSYGGAGQSYGGNGPLGLFYSFLDPYLRYQEFTWHEANYLCQSRGMQLVSLDNYQKDSLVSQLIGYYGVRWIWTSGQRSGYQFYWANGTPVGLYHNNWSYTGSQGIPQPDNAEGNEYCLAVLNYFYQDGIVWHDIGCSHRKSFVCEPYYR